MESTRSRSVSFSSFDGSVFTYRDVDGLILRGDHCGTERLNDVTQPLAFSVDPERVRIALDSQIDLLTLEATRQCNLRCTYCIYSGAYVDEPTYGQQSMTMGIAHKSVDYFLSHASSSQRVIAFYGGEPLLDGNEDFIKELVSYATQRAHESGVPLRFAVTTNGMSLQRWGRWLAQNRVLVFVSLDGPQEVQDEWRGKGTFRQVMRGLNSMRSSDPDHFGRSIAFSATFVRAANLSRMRDFFNREFPQNRIRISGVRLAGIQEGSALKCLAEASYAKSEYSAYALEFADLVSRGLNVDKFLSGLFDQMLMVIYYRFRGERHGPDWPTNACVPGGKKLFVSCDGDFFPCEKVYGDDFAIGCAETGVDPARVERLLTLYADTCNANCLDCWASRICASCLLTIRKGARLDVGMARSLCANKRPNLLLALRTYATIVDRSKEALARYMAAVSATVEPVS